MCGQLGLSVDGWGPEAGIQGERQHWFERRMSEAVGTGKSKRVEQRYSGQIKGRRATGPPQEEKQRARECTSGSWGTRGAK